MGNLNITAVQAAQNQKEVTINAGFDRVDSAVTETLDVSATAGGTIALSTDQFRQYARYRLTGSPGGAYIFQVPTGIKRQFIVRNDSTQQATIQQGASPGATIALVAGGEGMFYADAGSSNNIRSVGAAGGGGAGTVAVDEDGTEVVAAADRLNFTGPGVTVSDSGGGEVEINIPNGALGGSPGPWEHLETIDLAGATLGAPVSFTNIGGSQHLALMIVAEAVKMTGDSGAYGIRLNFGSGLVTTYKRVNQGFDSGGSAAPAAASNNTAAFIPYSLNQGNAAAEESCGYLMLFSPHRAGVKKQAVGQAVYNAVDGDYAAHRMAGESAGNETTAITGIAWVADATAVSIASGRAHIYGLRKVNPPAPYFIKDKKNGAPTASEVVIRHVFPGDTDFLEHLAGSAVKAGTAATASTVFDIQKNGVSIGNMTFAIAGTVPTITVTGGASFANGDTLTVIAPAGPDATLANIAWTLVGFHDLTALQNLWLASLP